MKTLTQWDGDTLAGHWFRWVEGDERIVGKEAVSVIKSATGASWGARRSDLHNRWAGANCATPEDTRDAADRWIRANPDKAPGRLPSSPPPSEDTGAGKGGES